MNKQIYASRLAEALGGLDDEILRKARDYRPVAKKKARWQVAVAACLVLALCLGAVLPFLGSDPMRGMGDRDIPAWMMAEYGQTAEIDSLHKINYYGALLAADRDTVTDRRTLRGALGYARLFSGMAGRADTDGERIDYFPIDPDEVFTVTEVIAFQIQLDAPENGTGFLASRLGVGVTDVVVTENNLETIITFRQGDRYFSCLLNGISVDKGGYSAVDGQWVDRKTVQYHFSTHKYIDGLYLVKNREQINYSFYFKIDAETGDVVEFRCGYASDGIIPGGSTTVPDVATVIAGSEFFAQTEATFTIGELQEQFR
ncbi:MAG: hypothetical protein J6D21_10925 [Clostridia bacterium]|nr:hypothetical protein [Clostridia bacterium]